MHSHELEHHKPGPYAPPLKICLSGTAGHRGFAGAWEWYGDSQRLIDWIWLIGTFCPPTVSRGGFWLTSTALITPCNALHMRRDADPAGRWRRSR